MISQFLKGFSNCFKVPELRKKILFTIGILAVYRIGCYVPTPGINGAALNAFFQKMNSANGGGNVFGIMDMFSGGALGKMTVLSLGVMPYISASIIMQLLTAVIPSLEKLSKEGQAGYKVITQYTRYGTVGLSLVQAFFIALWLESPATFGGMQVVDHPGWGFRLTTVVTLTAGSVFLMWLGERIQESGVGNGMSLVITAGILSRAPTAYHYLTLLLNPQSGAGQLQPMAIVLMCFFLIAVIISVTLISQGQRRIPVQYARRGGTTSTVAGQGTFIPLKVDTAGIIAIIFAQSIILFPATISSFIPHAGHNFWMAQIITLIQRGHWPYYVLYAALIIFFCYFYTAIVFNPMDVADNLKKHGGFVPGIRPGKETADYLDYVLTRITVVGSLFICVIAVMPDWIMASFKVPYLVASFFGGTGILIIVGVMLDTMKQIESHLQMHHYEGFMKYGQLRGRRS
ncbi:MAG: preprotein translocase subunit SecY [Candidatus Omnitrophica bacterium]|nr:preprotein translocase subunit SecY [Candidatus Omnitrophota bacterium]MDE2008504.1 preprotein translocase subunit SecY [Candidatus Omnitrophota bacterium]MDE2213970.1 preprotein translocase subunit SecY [Candidatus Omnitrophota bacterium]MDE2231375.1 preprotein translocase subunit SecY [Candidatus Omnitrophota bacterium]